MLQHEDKKSLFELSYPGYTKINIDITHEKDYENTDSKRFSMDISDITTQKLSTLLEDFIIEFQKLNC